MRVIRLSVFNTACMYTQNDQSIIVNQSSFTCMCIHVGVVLSKGMCGAKSPANINSGQWNVSIIGEI